MYLMYQPLYQRFQPPAAKVENSVARSCLRCKWVAY